MEDNKQRILTNGSRIGVIGGGPAGSFFSYFLLRLAKRVDIDLHVDIYESRDFTAKGPKGCNMCAGVISESLIQALSIEGINLPSTVVQKGINSFVLHSDSETVTMHAPFSEMRIATTYRGAGPRCATEITLKGFDPYIMGLAVEQGAKVYKERVTDLSWDGDKPRIHVGEDKAETYDLIVGAVGVNSQAPAIFEKLGIGYKRPEGRKTFNMEFALGADFVAEKLGSAMHAFLLNIPHLDFAALIPKGDFVTMCLIGDGIDTEFVDKFMQHPVVKEFLGESSDHTSGICSCAPYCSSSDAIHPFGNRVVLIGDCGISRLNKDGIGSAYRTAKGAAVTSLFRGVSAKDFEAGYWPLCKTISNDNKFGRFIYKIVSKIKTTPMLTRGVMRMIKKEQKTPGSQRRMSMVLWDMFTGSAPYRDVFKRCLHPSFIGGFSWNIAARSKVKEGKVDSREVVMEKGGLGKVFKNGEVIVRQGDPGDCMYVIQKGQAEVLQNKDGGEMRLTVLHEGDVFGEMALFQKQPRSATVRALGDVRVLTVDKRIFLKRVHEDPSFAFQILQTMTKRIGSLNAELVKMKN